MAVIYECDGCGAETKDSRKVKPVTVEVKSDRGQGPKGFHLCEMCETHLRERADPQTWVRPANAA